MTKRQNGKMTKRQNDERTKRQKGKKAKRQKGKKAKKQKDQKLKESLILWCQGSFALLRCLHSLLKECFLNNSEFIYFKLRRLGGSVEMSVLPGESHVYWGGARLTGWGPRGQNAAAAPTSAAPSWSGLMQWPASLDKSKALNWMSVQRNGFGVDWQRFRGFGDFEDCPRWQKGLLSLSRQKQVCHVFFLICHLNSGRCCHSPP